MRQARRIGIAVAAVLLGAVFPLLALRGAPELAQFERGPALPNCIDAAATPIGLADYWDAKPIAFFTRGKVTVEGIGEDGNPFPWVTRKDWARHVANESRTHAFFVVPQPKSRSRLLERYGEPARIDQCEGKEIWRYPPRAAAPGDVGG